MKSKLGSLVAFVAIFIIGVAVFKWLGRHSRFETAVDHAREATEFVFSSSEMDRVEKNSRDIDQAVKEGRAVGIECPAGFNVQSLDPRIVEFAKTSGLQILRYEFRQPSNPMARRSVEVIVRTNDAARLTRFIESTGK